MFWIIAAIIIGIVAVVELYLILNLNRKLSIYENWINDFARTAVVVDEELDRIDEAGTFRADDEIGYFYQAMYSILKRLSDIGIIHLGEELDGEPDEETEKQPNLLYERDRERNRRIQRVRRSDVSLDDIQNKNRKATKQTS